MDKKLKYLREAWHQVESSTQDVMTLYHGGRLDTSYEATKSHKKGRWEYGPGLYLTTHWGTAQQYAKGGGRRLYKITIERGTDIEEVEIGQRQLYKFIDSFIRVKNRKLLKVDLERWTSGAKIQALPFLNLVINDEAISSGNTGYLRSFLVENGVDYHKVSNPFGWGETMIVLYNMDKIQKKEFWNSKESAEDLPKVF